ncbi:hypothetical protein GCM10019060_33020 [Novosphingobium pokkalii]|nr:hypothetical protein GCM10019060_33020 [Novosphingobium pokkalii]
MPQALQAFDILWRDLPSGDDENVISEPVPIEQFKGVQHVLLHERQKRIGRAIKDLDGCDVGNEGPMRDQRCHGLFIIHHEVRALHLEVVEQVPHAVAAIEWAPDDMVQAEAGFPIFHDIAKARRQMSGCPSEMLFTFKIADRIYHSFLPNTLFIPSRNGIFLTLNRWL